MNGDDAASPAIITVDADGTVTGWTRAAQELLGYPASEVLNRSGAMLLMPSDRVAAGSLGEHWSGLVEARHRDGSRVLVHVQGSRLHADEARGGWCLSATEVRSDASGETIRGPLIDRSPAAMAIWDRDLRCVWLNETAKRLEEIFPFVQLGRRLEATDFRTDAVRTVMRRVLASGVPMIDREYRWTSPDERANRTYSSSFFRFEGVDGWPLGVCTLTLDVTHSRAREHLALLGEASTRIGSSLDVMRSAQEVADLTVPFLADYVTVDLAESVLPGGEPLQRLVASEVSIPVFRRAGVASIHPDLRESLWGRGQAVYVPPLSPFTQVLSSGRSHYEPVLDTSPGTWLDDDPDRAKTIRATGMHSLMIVPLRSRGEVLGIAVFVRTDNPAPFTKDDLILAEELANRAAMSLDNARQYTRERTTALALQRNLLPRRLMGGRAVEVASRYLPSDLHDGVGGDWYDVIPLRDDRVALVVGDVTGHGINAAATMGRLRTAVRTLAYLDLPPDELLTHLDDLVVRLMDEDYGAEGFPRDAMGATCVYVVYDPATRRCTMARAGHPPPAVVDPSGRVTFPRVPGGAPIGVGLGAFESIDLELSEGSLIVLYTDGLIETREADIDVGMGRLGAVLAEATGPLEPLCGAVIDAMTGGSSVDDDVALVIARTRGSS
ncbi:SpoIIE family protein phosphatase [Nonomuraea sp. K274]|uniref:protein-serine/threonine phosphatase n=1 Tax=Nonomuraea cypriaca TaxID=1187855 RepID=A0A931AEX2_9ACTN|nr:SpoIIE family protein phosphatase [Nonomuraea cypriaca]MBF8188815.1 SpoIIE family protein phosphatase [Nonomuraea cypriaca]